MDFVSTSLMIKWDWTIVLFVYLAIIDWIAISTHAGAPFKH
jgi:hypothetical protein